MKIPKSISDAVRSIPDRLRIRIHWKIFLLSLVIATLAWFGIRALNGFATLVTDIPVSIQPPAGWIVLDGGVKTVDISFLGTRESQRFLSRDLVKVSVDLREHTDTAPVRHVFGPADVNAMGAAAVDTIRPDSITVRMDRQITKQVTKIADPRNTFRMARGEGGFVLPQFFRSFRENFRRALPLWLLLVLALAVAGLDIWLFASLSGLLRLLLIPFILLLLLALFTAGYAFPLLSQFDNGVKATLKNALFLSLGYLPRTLLITALNVFPFALLLGNFYFFLYTGFIWVFLYFSAASYLIARLLEKVFAPYREEHKEERT